MDDRILGAGYVEPTRGLVGAEHPISERLRQELHDLTQRAERTLIPGTWPNEVSESMDKLISCLDNHDVTSKVLESIRKLGDAIFAECATKPLPEVASLWNQLCFLRSLGGNVPTDEQADKWCKLILSESVTIMEQSVETPTALKAPSPFDLVEKTKTAEAQKKYTELSEKIEEKLEADPSYAFSSHHREDMREKEVLFKQIVQEIQKKKSGVQGTSVRGLVGANLVDLEKWIADVKTLQQKEADLRNIYLNLNLDPKSKDRRQLFEIWAKCGASKTDAERLLLVISIDPHPSQETIEYLQKSIANGTMYFDQFMELAKKIKK